jgi:hypothetical protein
VRRKQFTQLIYDLRAELGKAVDPATGVADLPSLKQTIGRNYETLYEDFDWPHLSVISERIPLLDGERYYDFPDDIGYEGIERVVVWWNGDPLDLERGIDFEHYAAYESDDGEESDPAMRWDVRFTGTVEQCEIWPVPASSDTQTIQFRGKKKFVALVDDEDLCLIDNHLVVLSCAVELLPRQKSGDAEAKLAALRARYSRVRGRAQGGAATTKLGMGGGTVKPHKAIIRVGG